MQVLVTGGSGYVGSVLVRKLIKEGHNVSVLDKMMSGNEPLRDIRDSIEIFDGDIRNLELLKTILTNTDAVIHLACISNDPASELNHELTLDINYNATYGLLNLSKKLGVKRFIYASTSSVYGIKEEEKVTEDLPLEPLTIYSKTKAWAESDILKSNAPDFTTTSIRSATVCGYSPCMSFDTVVNLLTAYAINNNKITVFGGSQKRPNIHIDDITDTYTMMLTADEDKIKGQAFNVGFENHTVMQLAEMIRNIISKNVEIEVKPTDDLRSYHICSDKIINTLGFKPKKSISDAIHDIKEAFKSGKIPDWKSYKYYNVKKIKESNIL